MRYIKNYFSNLYKAKELNNIFFYLTYIIIPLIITSAIGYYIEFNRSILYVFGITLSVLIGLLFNFAINIGSKISSDHLSQKDNDKIKRLKLIKESYNQAFTAIYFAIWSLFFFFLLNIFNQFEDFNIIIRIFKTVSATLLLFLNYHLVLILFQNIKKLKKLLDVDLNNEKNRLK